MLCRAFFDEKNEEKSYLSAPQSDSVELLCWSLGGRVALLLQAREDGLVREGLGAGSRLLQREKVVQGDVFFVHHEFQKVY